jgi:predicted DCC family thiol-disulfide oxidoreductase YuxK
VETVERLTVLYDGGCALCVRCRDFLSTAEALVPLELLACQSEEARARYGDVPWLGAELVVADERGNVWIGPAAFVMCLWALADYREWSYRISSPAFAPLAERFFAMLSARRQRIAALLHPRCDGAACAITPRERPLFR